MSVKNKLLILLLQPLFPFFLYLFLPTLIIHKFPGPSFTSNQIVLPLVSGNVYQVSFSVASGNLNSVSLFLKNPNLVNTSAINLSLVDANGKILHELNTNGQSIGDPYKLTFTFPKPVSNLFGPFHVLLTTKNSNPQTLLVYGESSDNLNFQTQIVYPSFFTRFQQNIDFQFAKF